MGFILSHVRENPGKSHPRYCRRSVGCNRFETFDEAHISRQIFCLKTREMGAEIARVHGIFHRNRAGQQSTGERAASQYRDTRFTDGWKYFVVDVPRPQRILDFQRADRM
jgi:hypothetical protein